MTWAEVLGVASGGACVWLLARQSVWTWPLGLANNVFWLVSFRDAKLYADASLQVVFFALGCWGWWLWTRPPERRVVVAPRRTTRREWVWLAVSTVAATAAVALALRRWTDSPVPLPDACVLTLSLAATYGQAKKLIESWWIWIAVDLISVPLYLSRGLHLTAGIYVVFGVLCVLGLREWSRAMHAAAAPAGAQA